ncbi:MAG: MerR family transcriptional regulator, partial [Actinobacteria bacterium]|nr:MerR family transcriptional regulator [Actinomycetota bacterium]
MTTAGMNIAALAQRTGIAPDTLRKWEQRYAILQPVRTPGGQRRYCEEDVSRVEWLRARLDEGYRIGEAAALLGAADAEPCATPAELRSALRDALAQTDPEAVARLLDQTFALHRVESALSEVVRPLLQEVGDGWAAGRYRIAEEHLLSAAVRARLERLLAEARGTTRGVAVLACAPG